MFQIRSGSTHVADEFVGNRIEPSWNEAGSTEAVGGGPKIIVVDDQRLIADTIAEILQSVGFDVAVAYDGSSALDISSHFQPDYLLTDVLMPGMNGVELAIAIRKIYPGAKVLLFSGQAGISGILLEGRRQGFEFELIAKPIHPLKLIERLKDQG